MDVWQMVFPLIGGLGIFLLGMKNMSEGMQAIAGTGLRRMISVVTDNRLMATAVGMFVTMCVQSSSVTTVMVVGFVNSGLMQLSQAIGVIMGANIGTTITGWILVLKIGKYGLPMLGIAAFVYLFSKSDRWRYRAMTVMGIGMIFFGLELMKTGCSGIQNMPQFEDWLQTFKADNHWGVLKCMMAGCILTVLVQSSSATLGITMAFAFNGSIEFPAAAALVLGENIGTTVTALLASIGATTNARRAAYFHSLFNIAGAIWVWLIFFQYIEFVLWLLNLFGEVDVSKSVIVNGKKTFPDTTAAIAATHTIFNVTNTLIFLSFAPKFAQLLVRVVPDKAHKEKPHLTNLDIRILETPVIAIEQSRVEILRMGTSCEKMMEWLRQLLTQDEPDDEMVRKLFHREEVLDTIQDEIIVFMTNLLSGNVPHSIIGEGRCQMRMADEYESISDYVASILKFHLKLLHQGHRLDEDHCQKLLRLHDKVDEYLKLITRGYESRQPEIITKAHSIGGDIKHEVKSLRDQHLDLVTEEKIEPHVNVSYNAMLNSYRRVRDHALNIAEALAGMK